jgi:hypothetical protein
MAFSIMILSIVAFSIMAFRLPGFRRKIIIVIRCIATRLAVS